MDQSAITLRSSLLSGTGQLKRVHFSVRLGLQISSSTFVGTGFHLPFYCHHSILQGPSAAHTQSAVVFTSVIVNNS